MSLPLPNLDTRRWVDLVEEARAIIPRYAPAWTDHNLHDPGITLIELLAWLVETNVYRLNRVPESHRRKFLALVGIVPRPPQAATAVLSLMPPAPDPVTVPAGAEFSATTPEGNTLLFRTVEAVHAVPVVLRALLVQADTGSAPQEYTRLWREQGSVALLGDDPTPGAALWLGFDRPFPTGQPLRLAFTFAGERPDRDERQRILAEAVAQHEACRRPLPPAPAGAEVVPEQSRLPDPLPHHSARLVWEFSTMAGEWRRLDPTADHVRDDTRALTLDGAVCVSLPEDMGAIRAGSGESLYYLRVRVEAGEYDTPPLLADLSVNAVRVEQAVPVSQVYLINPGVIAGGVAPAVPGRARFLMQLDSAGAITALAFVEDENAPEIPILYYRGATETTAGVLVLALMFLGRSNGVPGQVFAVPRVPVHQGTLDLYTLEPPEAALDTVSWRVWHVQPDLDASNGRAAHVVLDSTRGEITFGDGHRGRIPPRGAPVLVRYRATAAGAGNIGGGQITTLAPTLHNWLLFDAADFQDKAAALGVAALLASDPARVWQEKSNAIYTAVASRLGTIMHPRPATGGATAETVTQAAGRAVAMLQAPTRAITSSDYEKLAGQTPGTGIARVHAVPGRHPAFPCLVAPGVITVVVVPAQRRSRPVPSQGLLTAVQRYLHRRRLVGTRVAVVGPRYLTVQVTARVKAMPGASPTRVRTDIISALNTFLHPLTGGPAVRAGKEKGQTLVPSPGVPAVTTPGVTLLEPAAPPLPVFAVPPLSPGWPFGRDVYRSEVLQVIGSVAGVDHILSLSLSGDGGPAQCGNLCVGPTELVVAGPHTIEVV
jgi:hypothetical protein